MNIRPYVPEVLYRVVSRRDDAPGWWLVCNFWFPLIDEESKQAIEATQDVGEAADIFDAAIDRVSRKKVDEALVARRGG